MSRAGGRMGLELAALRPGIGLVVVVNAAAQQALGCLVDNLPDIRTHPQRPEVLVASLVELVETHARIGRVHLQVKRRGLDRLPLVVGQTGKAVGEGVGDAEVPGSPFKGLGQLTEVCIATRS
jgi:hypothetical protein